MRRLKILLVPVAALTRLLGLDRAVILEVDGKSALRLGTIDILLQHDTFPQLPASSAPPVTQLAYSDESGPYGLAAQAQNLLFSGPLPVGDAAARQLPAAFATRRNIQLDEFGCRD